MRGLQRDSFSPFWFDRASPICDQLAILWHGAGNRELISGAFGVLSGTTPPTQDFMAVNAGGAGGGRVMKFNGGASATASYIALGANSQNVDIGRNAPMTAYAVFKYNTQSGPLAARNDNNSVNAGWDFDISGAAIRLRKEHAASNWLCATSLAGVTGEVVHACVVNDGTDTATAGCGIPYINGRQASSITLSAGSGIQGSDAAQTLYLGGNQSGMSGAVSLTEQVEIIAIWRRMLTPGEILSLYQDRLQLFRRKSQLRTMGVIQAAGAGGASQSIVFTAT
jgi:hypothetical protein